jgi:hypothetical protein
VSNPHEVRFPLWAKSDSEWDQETRDKWENSKFRVLNPKPKWKIAGINTLFRIIILSKIRLNLPLKRGEIRKGDKSWILQMNLEVVMESILGNIGV